MNRSEVKKKFVAMCRAFGKYVDDDIFATFMGAIPPEVTHKTILATIQLLSEKADTKNDITPPAFRSMALHFAAQEREKRDDQEISYESLTLHEQRRYRLFVALTTLNNRHQVTDTLRVFLLAGMTFPPQSFESSEQEGEYREVMKQFRPNQTELSLLSRAKIQAEESR